MSKYISISLLSSPSAAHRGMLVFKWNNTVKWFVWHGTSFVVYIYISHTTLPVFDSCVNFNLTDNMQVVEIYDEFIKCDSVIGLSTILVIILNYDKW